MEIVLCVSPSELVGPSWIRVVEGLLSTPEIGSVGCLGLDVRSEPKSLEFHGKYLPVVTLSTAAPLRSLRHSQTLEHFREFRDSADYGSVRFVSMKLLNRRDFTGTLRFLEREAIFQSQVLAVLDLLLSTRPRLIVFPVTPHEFLPHLVNAVAEYLAIEVLSFQPSQFGPTMLAQSSLKGTFTPPGTSAGGSAVASTVMAQTRRGFATLVGGRTPRYIEIQNASDVRS